MSKLYQMQRMKYGAAAGDPFLSGLLTGAVKVIGGLFKKKSVVKVAQAAGKAITSPAGKAIGTAALTGAAYAGAESLLSGGGRGASGYFGRRRRRGITALELRGYRKVANLIHKEGMVSRRSRGRR